jgi:hypothetical protein
MPSSSSPANESSQVDARIAGVDALIVDVALALAKVDVKIDAAEARALEAEARALEAEARALAAEDGSIAFDRWWDQKIRLQEKEKLLQDDKKLLQDDKKLLQEKEKLLYSDRSKLIDDQRAIRLQPSLDDARLQQRELQQSLPPPASGSVWTDAYLEKLHITVMPCDEDLLFGGGEKWIKRPPSRQCHPSRDARARERIDTNIAQHKMLISILATVC